MNVMLSDPSRPSAVVAYLAHRLSRALAVPSTLRTAAWRAPLLVRNGKFHCGLGFTRCYGRRRLVIGRL
jgi:hypothetical protein